MMSLREMYRAFQAYAEECVRRVADLRDRGFTHREIDTFAGLPYPSKVVWNGRRGKFIREQ